MTDKPKRIQCNGATWRTPERGAVYVGPESKWASPITFSDVGGQYPSLNDHQVATLILRDFVALAKHGTLSYPNWRFLGGRRGPVAWTYPSLDEIRAELGGRDLACWCEPELPCHADVLLELANQETQ